ncbi:MAG: hypothetical protein QGH11_06685, partial [Pirellulaceae bacterium]|nr:hypothetical protein [Pirellulaceae bacterium]
MATLELIVFLAALLVCASILLKRARWLGGSAWASMVLVLMAGVIGSVVMLPDDEDSAAILSGQQKRQLIANASTPVE